MTRRASIDPTTVTAEEIAAFSKPARRRSVVEEPRRGSVAPALAPERRKSVCSDPGRKPEPEGRSGRRRSIATCAAGWEDEKSEEVLAQERIAETHHIFSLFDKDGDGSITTVELALVLRSLGQAVSQEEVQDMMNEVDIDGNGELDFGEFMQLMSRYDKAEVKVDPTEEYKYAFKLFDKNGDGLITCEEFRTVMASLDEPLTEAEAQELICEVDMDGDGQIDYVEFSRLMMAKCE